MKYVLPAVFTQVAALPELNFSNQAGRIVHGEVHAELNACMQISV